MKVGFFSNGSMSFVGAVFEDKVFNLSLAASLSAQTALSDLTSLFREERFSAILLRDLCDREGNRMECWHEIKSLFFLPLLRPGKIICLGLNYRGHVEETNNLLPEEPIYFEKATSSIIANDQPVMYPSSFERIDPEIELAVVIGRRGYRIAEPEAWSYIAGYTILNDVTARDLQQRDIKKSLPWYRSKSLDSFCPIGPWIVTADEIGPMEALSIQLRVNGEVRQSSSTERLLFKIPLLVTTISELITLEPGDVISTGTPAGVAPIYPGDVMEGEIEKIGILRNPVKKAK